MNLLRMLNKVKELVVDKIFFVVEIFELVVLIEIGDVVLFKYEVN